MKFVNDRTTASLGTLMLGVKEDASSAIQTARLSLTLEGIMVAGDDTATPADPNSSVSFMGDFSFTSKSVPPWGQRLWRCRNW